jgi:hypothetical protein
MCATRKLAKHAAGIVRIAGLAKDVVSRPHDGVCREERLAFCQGPMVGERGVRFLRCQALNELERGLVWGACFVYVGRFDGELEPRRF